MLKGLQLKYRGKIRGTEQREKTVNYTQFNREKQRFIVKKS
jgi:hypothetical protein